VPNVHTCAGAIYSNVMEIKNFKFFNGSCACFNFFEPPFYVSKYRINLGRAAGSNGLVGQPHKVRIAYSKVVESNTEVFFLSPAACFNCFNKRPEQ